MGVSEVEGNNNNIINKKTMESLNENSAKSSMRVSFYWIIAMAGLLVAAISAVVVIQSVKLQPVDWIGIAAAIGAIGVFIAPAFGAKVGQKQIEKK